MLTGRVVSLHLHPDRGGDPLISVDRIELHADAGIVGNTRYYGRSSRRQVSLIEREQLAEHAARLGLDCSPPGAARAVIETEGIALVPLAGQRIQIGTAILEIYQPRDPCYKMDAVAPGLCNLMKPQKQGVMATIIHSGGACCGDGIRILAPPGA